MSSLYSVTIRSEFAAAHQLRDYPGECRRLHGHNWKVEVTVQGRRLDETGMLVDFKAVKEVTRRIADRLDHQFLNELTPFTEINPTAENIAAHFYHEIAGALKDHANGSDLTVKSVTIWETDRACATYLED